MKMAGYIVPKNYTISRYRKAIDILTTELNALEEKQKTERLTRSEVHDLLMMVKTLRECIEIVTTPILMLSNKGVEFVQDAAKNARKLSQAKRDEMKEYEAAMQTAGIQNLNVEEIDDGNLFDGWDLGDGESNREADEVSDKDGS